MRFLAALSVSAVLCLASAVPAVAADDGSAIDQYRENIPSGGPTKKPSAKERKSLESQGEDGRQLAEVLGAAGSGDASGGSGAASGGSSDAPAGGAGAAAGDAPTGTGGDGGSAGGEATSDGTGGGAAGSDADGSSRSGAADGAGSSTSNADESPVSTTVAASLGSDFGPAKLWVALVAVLVAAIGVAVLRRRSA